MIKLHVTWFNTTAAVSCVVPVMGVKYTLPVMHIEYSNPIPSAYLDVRGLHFRLVDHYRISDTQSLHFEKPANEQIALTDSNTWDVNKGVPEVLQLSESFDRVCAFYRTYSESVRVGDITQISLSKWYTENLRITDSAKLTSSKNIGDGVLLSESVFRKTGALNKTDSLRVSDTFVLTANSYSDVSYFAEDYVGETLIV